MSDDRIAEIRARLDAATPGPWRTLDWADPPMFVVAQPRDSDHWPRLASCGFGGDADLIANAPADIAWLLDEVDALRERVAILRADLEDLEDMADARGGDA